MEKEKLLLELKKLYLENNHKDMNTKYMVFRYLLDHQERRSVELALDQLKFNKGKRFPPLVELAFKILGGRIV